MNGKQVIKKLQSEGWQVMRIRGSHHIMRKNDFSVSIPVHGATDLKKGLLSKLEKQTGVKL